MRLPAYTRDGKQCNECGGAIEWDAHVMLHLHINNDAECLSGRRFAEILTERGEGHLLQEPSLPEEKEVLG